MNNVLRNDLFNKNHTEKLTKQFSENKPYPYCVIDQLCDDSKMRLIQTEILRELPATFKETDL